MDSRRVVDPHTTLRELLWGAARLQLVYVALKLGVPERLKDGPLSVEQLAAATDTNSEVIRRIARGWLTLRIVCRTEDGRLGLDALGVLLGQGSPAADWALQCGEVYYPGWGELLQVARTGNNGFELARGVSPWRFREQHPRLNESFNRLMASQSTTVLRAIVKGFDFSGVGRVVDVGGGSGKLLHALLEAHPALKGVLFDQPHVVQPPPPHLGSRCESIAGDFFQEIPSGGDVYLLKRVLHDWDDAKARAILDRCRQAMRAGALLLVVEQLLDEGALDPDVVLSDLLMLTVVGGRERTQAAFRDLLAQAGFTLGETRETDSSYRVLVATAA